ncbi:unnamed protein product, partial [Prorocentrum cordatum]
MSARRQPPAAPVRDDVSVASSGSRRGMRRVASSVSLSARRAAEANVRDDVSVASSSSRGRGMTRATSLPTPRQSSAGSAARRSPRSDALSPAYASEEASEAIRRYLAQRKTGAAEVGMLQSMRSVAAFLLDPGLKGRAAELSGDGAAVQRRKLLDLENRMGADHPDTLTAAEWLADMWPVTRQVEEAEALYRRVLAARTKERGARHISTLSACSGLALLLRKVGRPGDAASLSDRVFQELKKSLGPSQA